MTDKGERSLLGFIVKTEGEFWKLLMIVTVRVKRNNNILHLLTWVFQITLCT